MSDVSHGSPSSSGTVRTHRLVLPLPSKYASNVLPADTAYSSFIVKDDGETGKAHQGSSSAENSSSPLLGSTEGYESLNMYLDDLCAFLRDYRLVQYHPEHYFHYVLGSAWLEKSTHRDGSPVTQQDVDTILRLCRAFIPFFDKRETTGNSEVPSTTSANLDAIHHLIMRGPGYVTRAKDADPDETKPANDRIVNCDPFLMEYYTKTKEMMMCRQRRPLNDSASMTLRTALPSPAAAAAKESADSSDVLDHLLDYGMGPKKRHEVEVMRSTMYDLVTNCCHVEEENAVHTIMNIGEGKGYVSRVMAMNDGFQVVGLDCNPHHKEKQLERTEFLLEGRLGRRDQSGEMKLVNLLYRPRGRMVSVACRVGPHADWKSILSSHVPLLVDGTTVVIPAKDTASELDRPEDSSLSPPTMTAAAANTPAIGMGEKVVCRLCGQILRRTGAALLVRHAQAHFRRDRPNEPLKVFKRTGDAYAHSESNGCDTAGLDAASVQPSLPTTQNVLDWVKDLSSKEYADRVISTFFSGEVRFKKTRSGEAITPTEHAENDTEATEDDAKDVDVKDNRRAVDHLTRGMHIRIRLDRELFVNLFEGNLEEAGKVVLDATVFGFDFAAEKHRIIFDGSNKKLMVRLVHPEPDDADSAELPPVMQCEIEALLGRAAATFPAKRMPSLRGTVLHVFPFPPELSWPVKVPSLANTAMMGLHPCGDLGANVCRIFLSSRSSALLLVSCCWHALTNDAFPLSHAFRSRGLRTESLSLMLATQPLDMWASASAQGHRGSVRMLFQRSMLHYLWFLLKDRYAEELRKEGTAPADDSDCTPSPQGCAEKGKYCCPLVEPPYLEPSFLRRISKVKNTIKFTEFLQCVLHEYLAKGVEGGASIAVEPPILPTLQATPWRSAKQVNQAQLKEEDTGRGGGREEDEEESGSQLNNWKDQCPACRVRQLHFLVSPEVMSLADAIYDPTEAEHFKPFVGFTVLRIWASHLVETILLLDRALYLHEALHAEGESDSSVSLVPLFDGALSPRMYGILAARQ